MIRRLKEMITNNVESQFPFVLSNKFVELCQPRRVLPCFKHYSEARELLPNHVLRLSFYLFFHKFLGKFDKW